MCQSPHRNFPHMDAPLAFGKSLVTRDTPIHGQNACSRVSVPNILLHASHLRC